MNLLVLPMAGFCLDLSGFPPLPPIQPDLSFDLVTSATPPAASNVVIIFATNKVATIQVSNDLRSWTDLTNGISPITLPIVSDHAFYRGWYHGDVLHVRWGELPTNYTSARAVGLWVPTQWTCVYSTTNLEATNAIVWLTNSPPNGFNVFVAGMTDGKNWWPFTQASHSFYSLAGTPDIPLNLTLTNQ